MPPENPRHRRSPPEPIALADGLDASLAFRLCELTPDLVRAELTIHDRVRQRFGLVHGGTYSAIAECLASEGTYAGVCANGQLALGQENTTFFLRPVDSGTVAAEARPRHRGAQTWLWDVGFTNSDGDLCALSRVLVAVRAGPGEAPGPLDVDAFNEAVAAAQRRTMDGVR